MNFSSWYYSLHIWQTLTMTGDSLNFKPLYWSCLIVLKLMPTLFQTVAFNVFFSRMYFYIVSSQHFNYRCKQRFNVWIFPLELHLTDKATSRCDYLIFIFVFTSIFALKGTWLQLFVEHPSFLVEDLCICVFV